MANSFLQGKVLQGWEGAAKTSPEKTLPLPTGP